MYTNVETALINSIYYHKYGQHRCNLIFDVHLGIGIYSYTDMEALMKSLDSRNYEDKQRVIGLISGYLHQSGDEPKRISLDPRCLNTW